MNGQNAEFIDAQYKQWQNDPTSVDLDWQRFFEGFELGNARPAAEGVAHSLQGKVDSLIYHYRDIGHFAADLDPLGSSRPFPEELTLESFGLSDEHLDETFDPGVLPLDNPAPLREIVELLEETYCRHIGVEYMHIQERERRRWLQKRMETVRNQMPLPPDRRLRILDRLLAADVFENFLQARFIGKKRFGLEGGESLITAMDTIIELGPPNGIDEFTIGMAHRGRLNVLCNILGKTFDQLFTEFAEAWEEDFVEGGGDVKYHQGYSHDHLTEAGNKLRLTLAANPSHLEYVNAIVLGRARAKQRLKDDENRDQVVPVLVHGDAAFPGQGIVAETFNMMKLEGYSVGGTVHVVVNNQVGFTTDQHDLFSGRYCTEIAKMVEAPIFHVNGDDPEACAWVARLALEFRQAFHTDVVLDIWCYRKNGHNETDEPAFTQPLMYRKIRNRPSVAERYRDTLIEAGVLDSSTYDSMRNERMDRMDSAQQAASQNPVDPTVDPFQSIWSGLTDAYEITPIDTGIDRERLEYIIGKLTEHPEDFTPHKTISKGLKGRGRILEDTEVDWATAELAAYGSLLMDGCAIRLTGQDVERGTFSHRHSRLHDQETGESHIPLNELSPEQAKFCVHNSPLTESACVGYEYGYSLTDPRMLIIWEAQFGDFANGAQVMIDQFIASAEAKWQRSSGLALFLPHGYEGQGPEHSSARLERFLQLCADENMQVCYPSRASQVFHMIRRQMMQPFRKPLIVMTPKSMLRMPVAKSPIERFVTGGFLNTIDDTMFSEQGSDRSKVKRVAFCTGKIYYELNDRRREIERDDIAIVRIEQLYPFPAGEIREILDRYPAAEHVDWIQEEPRNMGAFRFIQTTMADTFDIKINGICRDESASPAVGSSKVHAQEQEAILTEAIGSRTPSGQQADSNEDSSGQAARSA
ncbi:MAG: 2-oxoglutarate dehydrogenase E1 component [Phycisphaerales bacterium]|nr:2-oxoglutarate dehydrogenase E1 component [Phycisphaerales bacterium]